MSLSDLSRLLADFNRRRDWDQFHNPRNLVLALSGEVGEIASLLQWVPDADTEEWLRDRTNHEALAGELADVLAYLVQLADRVQVDLDVALREKIRANEERYPVEKARGSTRKYHEL